MVISSTPKSKEEENNNNNNNNRGENDNNNDNDNNIDNDEVVLSATIYKYMTPSTRILALGQNYYVLKHSSASTLVSCSLVIFGAIPLSYRSYIFSIQYSDWLISSSWIMAVSVVGTISYGILSQRWKSRTSQSFVVSNALCERIYSRNDSSYYTLQQNSIQNITKNILNIYYNNNNNHNNNIDSNIKNDIICYDSNNNNKNDVVNPIEWAIDFGLLLKQQDQEQEEQPTKTKTTQSSMINEKNSGDGDDSDNRNNYGYYKAVSLDDALICMNTATSPTTTTTTL
jgi:hypothetical protein